MTEPLPGDSRVNGPGNTIQPSERPASGSLSIAALVLSFLVPVVGLVLALIARSGAKRAGHRADAMARAALIISSVLTASGLLLIAGALIFTLIVSIQLAAITTVPVTGPVENEVTLSVSGVGTSAGNNEDLLNAAASVVAHRLQRAGIVYSTVEVGNQESLIISFPDSASDQEMEAAAALATVPTAAGIREVLGYGEASAGGGASFSLNTALTQNLVDSFPLMDCSSAGTETDGARTLDEGFFIACDTDLQMKSLFGADFIPGDGIASHSVSSTEIDLSLNSAGAQPLAALTTMLVNRADAASSQIALTVGNEVVFAGTVNSVITDGHIVFSGSGFDSALINSQLILAERGASVSIVGIQAHN